MSGVRCGMRFIKLHISVCIGGKVNVVTLSTSGLSSLNTKRPTNVHVRVQVLRLTRRHRRQQLLSSTCLTTQTNKAYAHQAHSANERNQPCIPETCSDRMIIRDLPEMVFAECHVHVGGPRKHVLTLDRAEERAECKMVRDVKLAEHLAKAVIGVVIMSCEIHGV